MERISRVRALILLALFGLTLLFYSGKLFSEQLIKNDENFERTVDLLLTYFQMGGVHFQLTYVSKEDLLNAQVTPDDYKHLRVRVSGFSDYFVKLNEAMQDDIIRRTAQTK